MRRFIFLHGSADSYGSAKVLYQINKILTSNNEIPIVILPHHGELVDLLQRLGVEVIIINLGVLRRMYFTPLGLIGRIFLWVISSIKISRIIKNRDIDIIYVNSLNVIIGPLIKRITGKKLIWHIHEIVESPIILKRILRNLISSADLIIAVSNATKIFWEKGKHEIKINLLYNGIDFTQYSIQRNYNYRGILINKDIGENEILIGMIGRVQAWKGQTYFIEIIEQLFERYPHMRIKTFAVIVGDTFPGYDYLFSEMLEHINRSNLESNIFCLGYRNDIPQILSSIDILILPSILPDPLPTVVLEAMASGIPVLATHQGGALEMVVENSTGQFIPIGDASTSSSILYSMLLNRSNLANMGLNGRRRVVNHFSYSSFEINWLKLCKET